MKTRNLDILSIFALITIAAATAACTSSTDENEPPQLGTTTNGNVPTIVAPTSDEATPTVQQSRLPLLMKEPALWEPVENAAPVDPPAVHVNPAGGWGPRP